MPLVWLRPMWARCLNESGVGEEIMEADTPAYGGESGEDEDSLGLDFLLDLILRLRERFLETLAMIKHR